MRLNSCLFSGLVWDFTNNFFVRITLTWELLLLNFFILKNLGLKFCQRSVLLIKGQEILFGVLKITGYPLRADQLPWELVILLLRLNKAVSQVGYLLLLLVDELLCIQSHCLLCLHANGNLTSRISLRTNIKTNFCFVCLGLNWNELRRLTDVRLLLRF